MSTINHDNPGINLFTEAFSNRYRPVRTIQEATHFFSTQELFRELKQINPGLNISIDQVHDAMIEAGYIYQAKPGYQSIKLFWLGAEVLD
ncbi:MAG: 5-formyltetrahydrofolate cyclo-ligase [Bacteroides sp.]|nr:5-formyltetrahydrofolate cyclo-ligase [Bacteroides sp.]